MENVVTGWNTWLLNSMCLVASFLWSRLQGLLCCRRRRRAANSPAIKDIVFSVVEVVPPSQQCTLSLCQIKSLKQKATQVTLFNRTVYLPQVLTCLHDGVTTRLTFI
ncbi:hypothetical protein EYF80_059355 [Liparis tanakae]|uniref:Uncharacterized protein n=1 Tax=Liparis tanakae TaxID=230148 RepID=A0A4Z2ENX1_9TELE|nr:hypothetical protein EYF80_059355 [Liparis tanakae]